MKKTKKLWMRVILIALTVSLIMQGVLIVLPKEASAYQLVLQPSDIDSDVRQAYPSTNDGKNPYATIRSAPMSNTRILLKFDISALGLGYVVTNAVLTLKGPTGTVCEDFDLPTNVHAYRARTYWGESSVTWEKEPDYAAEPSGEDSDVQISILNFEITNLVEDWYDGTYDNYGVMLRMAHEGGDGEGDTCGNSFIMRDYVPPPSGLRPKLTIDYEDAEDYVDIEIVEPKMTVDPPEPWDVLLSNNCSCPTLKSRVDYLGTLVDVRYEITTDIPMDPWSLTLLATYDDHTGLWVAELDCWKLKDLGANYYVITAKATISGVAPATDLITVKVDNEWHTERLVWVWYYYSIPCQPPNTPIPTNPRQVYAEFEEFDGENELFRVDIEAPYRPIASDPLWCIDIAVPNYWQIATESGQEIINIPHTDVFPTAPPPGSPYTQAYRIEKSPMEDPGMMWLYTEVTYELGFLVDNPWYR